MTPEDQARLQRLCAPVPLGTRLRLNLTRHEHSPAFQDFGRRLQALAPHIDLVTDINSEAAAPWMETPSGVRFHALPQDDKLDSFAKALVPRGAGDTPISEAHRALLERIPLPASVRLFIAPGCPHCPRALQRWIALAGACEHLGLHVVDAVLFPEMARAEAVKAVPTLVIDGQMRWAGRIPVVDVLGQLVERDPGRLSADALDGMIKEGRAGQVARSMIDKGALFPAITDLLTHAKWPVRLGAMVVMEEIAAADRPLAAQVVPSLQKRFDALDDAVKGDVVYIIGETGDQRMLPFLQTIMETSVHPEVRQAAMEAVTAIQERSGIASAEMH